jgi:glycosyltransferase involved in cell wall biosynthesis
MSAQVSIIIPVYNAAACLCNCLDSILAQTYTNLEILLINDGSIDESLSICRGYAQKDTRIRVIDQQNEGVSSARNAGLSHATGDYIAFVDADDYLATDYIERLYTDACTYDADIVCCNFFEILNGETVEINTPKVLRSRLITEPSELFFDFVECKEAYGTSVWAKIIRSSLAKQISFQSLAFGEDQIYMFDLFTLSPKVYLNEYKGYYYIRNESSVTISSGMLDIKRNRNELQMQRYKLDHLPSSLQSLYPRYYNLYAMSICVLAKTASLLSNRKQRAQTRRSILPEIGSIMQKKQWISMRNRLYLNLYRYLPGIYRLLLVAKQGRQ